MDLRIDHPLDMIDAQRYPLGALDTAAGRAVVDEQRRTLAERGVAILPGFLRPEVIGRMASETLELKPKAHLEDAWGTPYLALPDESYPPGHPRRSNVQSITWVIAYDLIPTRALVRRLYEWDPMMHFVGAITGRHPLYRMADPLGALNLTIMTERHTQGWHYDNADFVVSLAIQSSCGGGAFECASALRQPDDENYPDVARVMAGTAPERVDVLPMTPGTLMIFAGRNSLHRVSEVEGAVPRMVALFAYDTRPDADSSELLKLIRYGRSTPVTGDA